MRIAVFHELPRGGARRAVNSLSRELKKKHAVDLYIVDDTYSKEEEIYFTNITFFSFKPKAWKGKNWRVRLYKDTIELFKLYLLHKHIAHLIKLRGYDLIFIHSSKYTEAPFLLRFPIGKKVFYCHDPHYRMLYEDVFSIPKNLDIFRQIYERVNRVIRKTIDRSNFLNADVIFANSEYTKKGVKKTYGRESTVCYLGVDINTFKPLKIKKNIDIFYIGSREAVDGYQLLQNIISKLSRNTVLKIITTEDEWISDDSILAKYYSRSKIVLSLAVNEPLGLTPLEAMACGTPVIATNDAGHRETIIGDKTGFLLRRNPQLIVTHINMLLGNRNLRRSMEKNARNHIVKDWTWKKAAGKIEKEFLRLVS